MKDGGPAFPMPAHYDDRVPWMSHHHQNGMSLRDYFAAKAMIALWSNPVWIASCTKQAGAFEIMDRLVAMRAYSMADAMLAERDSETPSPQGGYGG